MAITTRTTISVATKVSHTPKLLMGTVLLSGLLALSACQEADDSNGAVNNESNHTATTPAHNSESITTTPSTTPDDQQLDPNYKAESVEVIDVETTNPSETGLEGVSTAPNQQPSTTDSSNNLTDGSAQDAIATQSTVPSSEIQVTDVEYQDSKGRSIYVTFKTSATATLQADLRLPNGKRVLLTAPTGQGNNPTYHSTDGSVELVTHGGGASVDLFYNNKRTQFDAIETEAEVIKPQ